MDLPIPHGAHSHRILTEVEAHSGAKRPGVRASNSRWQWLGRSIIYEIDGQSFFINRNSAIEFLKRNQVKGAKALTGRQIVRQLELIQNRRLCGADETAQWQEALPPNDLNLLRTHLSGGQTTRSAGHLTYLDLRQPLAHQRKKLIIATHSHIAYVDPPSGALILQAKDAYLEGGESERLALYLDDRGHVSAVASDEQGPADRAASDRRVQQFKAILRDCYQQVIEDPLAYDQLGPSSLQINIHRQALSQAPVFQLRQLTQPLLQLDRKRRLHFGVLFRNEPGHDAGGVRREYLDSLFSQLLASQGQGMLRFAPQDDGTALPLSQTPYQDDSLQLPLLGEDEADLLMRMGMLYMNTYYSAGQTIIGRHLPDRFLKLALAMATGDKPAATATTDPQQLLDLFELLAQQGVYREPLAYCQLLRSAEEPAPARLQKLADELAVAPHWPAIQHEMRESLFQLFGAQLSAAQAFARGLAQRYNPSAGRTIDPSTFVDKVQGTLDRTAIAQQIVLYADSEILRAKTQWLRNWIRDPQRCPDATLKSFLKFCTGSSGLPKDAQIGIQAQQPPFLPFAKAHTCAKLIDLAPQPCRALGHDDSSEEGFLRALVEVSLAQTGFSAR